MRITSITARNYRIHRDLKVELENSLTLIGGPNEVGKSTLVEAAHRALFLKARVTGEIQKSMPSREHTGHPEVEVCFEAGGRSYRITKRFSGATGSATLTVVNGPTWHGEEAEARLAEILGVAAMGGGRGVGDRVAQQWAHLWVWQGQAGTDPTEHATTQKDSLLARLQDCGGAAAMQSELDAAVANIFAERHASLFTKSLSPKKDSDFGRAAQEAAEAETAFADAQQTLEKLQQAVTDSLEADKTIQSSQKALARLEPELDAVVAKLAEVETLRTRERNEELAAEHAVSAHNALAETDKRIWDVRAEIRTRSDALAPKNAEGVRLAERESECDRQARLAQEAYQQAIETARSARLRHDLAVAHATLFERAAQRNRLLTKLEQVGNVRGLVRNLEAEMAALPAIDSSRMEAIRELESAHSLTVAALQAMAAGIDVLSSDVAVQVGETTLEVGQSQVLTEETEIAIGSCTRLRITPGGGTSLSDARRRVHDARTAIQQELDTLGVKSTAEAADAYARRQRFEADVQAGTAQLAGLGAETIDHDVSQANNAFIAAEADLQHRAALVDEWCAPESEAAACALVTQTAQQLRAVESEESRCKSDRDSSAQELQEARDELAAHRQAIHDQERKLTELEVELRLLLSTGGEDSARSARLAELLAARTRAESQLARTRQALAELQPELLESDKTRLRRALEQSRSDKAEAETRREVARRILQSDGSSDPQAAVALADARLHSAREHLASVERRANAIRLLHQLFTEEQRALAEQFTRPLAERITGYLQCLFGPGVQANLRLEGHAFVGLELVRPYQGVGAIAFDSLSAGAREQVAAAVRLAMAEVLAADHDGCLPVVFDDSFAYSDPDRVTILQRMLDRAASRGLQVIVLSCNPSDYAALGAKSILLRTAPVSQLPAKDELAPDFPEPADSTEDVGGGPPAAEAGTTAGANRREQLLDALRAAGGSKGNLSLRQSLGWDPATYESVKNELIATGEIVPGRGKGGSVALAPDRS